MVFESGHDWMRQVAAFEQKVESGEFGSLPRVALLWARKAHEGQFRLRRVEGERLPYISHPLELAATLVLDFRVFCPIAIAIALLHDSIEDGLEKLRFFAGNPNDTNPLRVLLADEPEGEVVAAIVYSWLTKRRPPHIVSDEDKWHFFQTWVRSTVDKGPLRAVLIKKLDMALNLSDCAETNKADKQRAKYIPLLTHDAMKTLDFSGEDWCPSTTGEVLRQFIAWVIAEDQRRQAPKREVL